MYCAYYKSPVGILEIRANEKAITHVLFSDEQKQENLNACIRECCKQLDEYFEGKRTTFDLPLQPTGTPFQEKVWKALCSIPYGETCSYHHIAKLCGNDKASRAVGMANNRNPISIIVPCHRVIGASGKMVGYGGGLDKKIFLLELEERIKKTQ
ncbi:methylated-DNA--[protein]-cysteine S-methyltransferase [Amedibacillus sp. YH-ame6]